MCIRQSGCIELIGHDDATLIGGGTKQSPDGFKGQRGHMRRPVKYYNIYDYYSDTHHFKTGFVCVIDSPAPQLQACDSHIRALIEN